MRWIVVSLLPFLVAGCSPDRLRLTTAECAVEAHRGEPLWYAANASNTRAGLIAFTKLVDGRQSLEVWRGCGPGDRSTLPLAVTGISRLTISGTGRYAIASAPFASLEILDLEANTPVAHLKNCAGPAVFSPDERLAIFSCHSGGVVVYDLVQKRTIGVPLYSSGDSVMSMSVDTAFGQLAIGEGGGKVVLLDIRRTTSGIESTNETTLDEGRRHWISELQFSASGQALYVVSRDGQVDAWSTASSSRLATWATPARWVGQVTFIDDARRAVIFGTRAANGMSMPVGIVINPATGQQREFVTDQNGLWGAYIPSSDAMFVTGFWIVPRIERDLSDW